ncbi:MAG: TlpA disulfide reductase family protein [Anaerolineales bacterium]|nr:TlpA disulfide reductase family protein [Anaerolineales bacterium]
MSKHRKRPIPIALLAVGAGLLLLGIVAFGALSGADKGNGEADLVRVGFGAPAQVSFPAPDLRLTDLQGAPVSLSDYRDRVVLINNWATWCLPCEAEMPTLQAYYQAHQHQNFALIAIDVGEPVADILPFKERYGLTFEIWLDPNLLAIAAFRNSGLPSTYVVDSAGTVRYAWAGAVSHETLEKYVTPMLED